MARERKMNTPEDRELLFLVLKKFFTIQNASDLTISEFAGKAKVYRSTMLNALAGKAISIESERRIKERVSIEIKNMEEAIQAINLHQAKFD